VTIAENLANVRSRIDRSARSAGRDPSEITLVAVSKTKSAEAVREAFAAGQRVFGESYAQELAAKAAILADLPDLRWHFVGHVQTNKAKLVARYAHAVQSVDSEALSRELARRVARERSGERLSVLIEVNVGREPQKSGVAPSEIDAVIQAIVAHPDTLALQGLMTVPPGGDHEVARRCFEELAALRDVHGRAALLPHLSMGMSDDLEVAIACGATIVRVGTAVFGAREG
jgi:pyridoxal phosphate enzyme (YggS family)